MTLKKDKTNEHIMRSNFKVNIWSPSELEGTFNVYVDMLIKEVNNKSFIKTDLYKQLSQKYGRSPKAYEFRMQNISFVFMKLGYQWVKGLKPLSHVGEKNYNIIKDLIDESADYLVQNNVDPIFNQQYKEKQNAKRIKRLKEKKLQQKAKRIKRLEQNAIQVEKYKINIQLIVQNATQVEKFKINSQLIPIDECNFSVRAMNIIKDASLGEYLHDLANYDRNFIGSLPNCGRNTLIEIRAKLKEINLDFGMNIEVPHSYIEEFRKENNEKEFNINELEIIPIDECNFSVRAMNIINHDSLGEYLHDLANYDRYFIASLPNCGRNTLKEIRAKLQEINLDLGMNIEVPSSYIEQWDHSKSKFRAKKDHSLVNIIESLISKKYKEILPLRLSGLYTLERTANRSGVTRERIRQLEKKVKKQISKKITSIAYEINNIKLNEGKPTYFWELEVQNEYFRKSSNYLRDIKYSLIAYIFDNQKSKYRIECVKGEFILSNKETLTYRKIKETLKYKSHDYNIRNFLLSVGRTDLQKYISSDFDHLIKGKTRREITPDFLKEIYRDNHSALFSTKELEERCQSLMDYYDLNMIIDHPNIISEAILMLRDSDYKIYQFERHGKLGWGLEAQFKRIDNDEIIEISNMLKNLLRDSKPRHIDKIRECIKKYQFNNHNININKNLMDKYDVKWLLEKSMLMDRNFKKHGRFLYSYSETRKEKIETIADIAHQILDKNNKPMNTSDLLEEINNIRYCQQLHVNKSNPEIIMFSPKKFGLKSRDLKISKNQEDELIKIILRELTDKDVIYEDHIKKIMKECNIHNTINIFQVFQVLKTHCGTGSVKARQKNSLFIVQMPRDDKFSVSSIISLQT